jgi:hypothetical protein
MRRKRVPHEALVLEAIESAIRAGLEGVPENRYQIQRLKGRPIGLPHIFEVTPTVQGAAKLVVATDLYQTDLWISEAYYREFTWTTPDAEDLKGLTDLIREAIHGRIKFFRSFGLIWAEARQGEGIIRTPVQFPQEFIPRLLNSLGLRPASISRPLSYKNGLKES